MGDSCIVVDNINNLIALCYVLDDYSLLMSNLEGLLNKGKRYGDITIAMFSLLNKGFDIKVDPAIYDFYYNNLEVINKINNYISIASFFGAAFNHKGRVENSYLDFFYNYINVNRNNFNLILNNLLKLKELGFSRFSYSESLNFTDEVNCLSINSIGPVNFFSNMYAIPTYDSNVIKYKTSGSSYRMFLYLDSYGDIGKSNRQIYINDLLFDPNSLPDSICKQTIVDAIISLGENNSLKCDALRSSIDFSNSVDALYRDLTILAGILPSIKGDNCSIKHSLESLSKGIKELKNLSFAYGERVCEQYEISPNILALEKKI